MGIIMLRSTRTSYFGAGIGNRGFRASASVDNGKPKKRKQRTQSLKHNFLILPPAYRLHIYEHNKYEGT